MIATVMYISLPNKPTSFLSLSKGETLSVLKTTLFGVFTNVASTFVCFRLAVDHNLPSPGVFSVLATCMETDDTLAMAVAYMIYAVFTINSLAEKLHF